MKKTTIRILSFLFILVLLRVLFFEIYTVNQSSMKNTFSTGDKVLITKRFYTLKNNDILVFEHEKQTLIKRCIGLAGDTVEIIKGVFFINNKQVPHPPKAVIKENSETDVITRSNIYFNYGANWTTSDFGPYIIPKKGMKLSLTPENIALYGLLIKDDSVANLKLPQINKQQPSFYIFKHDYLFLVGDNRPESIDSRIFGPIAQADVRGKVILKF